MKIDRMICFLMKIICLSGVIKPLYVMRYVNRTFSTVVPPQLLDPFKNYKECLCGKNNVLENMILLKIAGGLT